MDQKSSVLTRLAPALDLCIRKGKGIGCIYIGHTRQVGVDETIMRGGMDGAPNAGQAILSTGFRFLHDPGSLRLRQRKCFFNIHVAHIEDRAERLNRATLHAG